MTSGRVALDDKKLIGKMLNALLSFLFLSLKRPKKLVSSCHAAVSAVLFLWLSLVSILLLFLVSFKVIAVVTVADRQIVQPHHTLDQLGCVGWPLHPDARSEYKEPILEHSELPFNEGAGLPMGFVEPSLGSVRVPGERRDEPICEWVARVAEDNSTGEGSLTLCFERLPHLAVAYDTRVMPLPGAFG